MSNIVYFETLDSTQTYLKQHFNELAAQEPAVHITAGLPFLRVSPTHGTAFDIAGQGVADAQGMAAAVLRTTVP